LKRLDVVPDVVIGCCGGGSNLGGMAFPFLPEKLSGTPIKLLAVEPAACPTLTRGAFTYDLGDEAGYTPLIPMYTLGHDFMPSGIHAGGLRYHGASALVSQLHREGLIDAVAYSQNAVFEAAVLFARTEGILPAPESSHAIRAAVDEAIKARDEKKRKTIVFNLSGHGHFDLSAYDDYLKGNVRDVEVTDEEIRKSLSNLGNQLAI
jgi:tryptophan synthase beta chain